MKRLFALALVVFGIIYLSACGQQAGPGEETKESAPDAAQVLEDCIREAMSPATAETVEEIRVQEINGEYKATIRTYLGDGTYFLPVIEETAQAFFDKAAELGVTVSEYLVTEYTESTTGGIKGMVAWKSKDGAAGTFSDDTGKSPVVIPAMTIDELRAHFGLTDFGDDLAAYQGEWARDDIRRYHRLIISGDTVNFVNYDDLEESAAADTVNTFFFGYADGGGLVVNNQHGQARYTVELDGGKLTLHSLTGGEPEVYEKVSDKTDVPTVAE